MNSKPLIKVITSKDKVDYLFPTVEKQGKFIFYPCNHHQTIFIKREDGIVTLIENFKIMSPLQR